MAYVKQFTNPYPDGWVDLPIEETPIDAEALQAHTDAIEGIDNYLAENPPDELKESLTQLYADGFASRNAFNPKDSVVQDGYAYKYSVKVKPNTTYIASTDIPNEATADIYLGTYSGAYRVDKDTTRTTVSDASGVINIWIRHSNTTSGTNYYEKIKDGTYHLQLEEGTVAHDWTEYAISNTGLTQIVDDSKADGYLAENFIAEVEQGAFNVDTGANNSSPSTTTVRTVGYVNVNKNTEYTIYSDLDGARCYVCEFTNQGTTIVKRGWQTMPYKFTSGANTNYIRVLFANASSSTVTVQSFGRIRMYDVPSNTELKQSLAQVDKTSVNSTGVVNFTRNEVSKNMQSVEVLLSFNLSSGTTSATNIGTVSYAPSNEYAFLDIFSQDQPYAYAGKIFIRRGDKSVNIPKDVPSGNYFAQGSYITKD